MYKKIKQGQILTVTGSNLYSGVDTAVYFNNVTESSKAKIVPSGYNETDSRIAVIVPSGLPEENKIIIYNGYNYVTGSLPYKYVGRPEISGFTQTSQVWNQNVSINGNYLDNVRSGYVGGYEITDYDWPSKNKFTFRVPRGLTSGQVSLYTDVGLGTSRDHLVGEAPNVSVELTPQSQGQLYYGDIVNLQGESLHKANRLAMSGVNGHIYVTNHSGIDTTGIKFVLPEGVVDGSFLYAQYQSGAYQGGSATSEILEQDFTSEKLKVVSNYIYDFDKPAAIYNEQLKVRGVNLSKSKIYFEAFGDKYVESEITSSGHNYVNVLVPKNIKYGNLKASGDSTHVSSQNFYPLPTISGSSLQNWTMGESISITGINAFDCLPVIGISGTNLINGEDGIYFVASNDSMSSGPNYFGSVSIDNSSLSDPVNGYSVINGVVNSKFAGVGYPFLVSSYDTNQRSAVEAISGSLNQTLLKLGQALGEQVRISGKQPVILGASKVRATRLESITISGKYFLNHTGLKLSDQNDSVVLAKSGYNDYDSYGSKIYISETGNVNTYEQIHNISVDLSKFSGFAGKQGTFKILTPYHGN